MRSRVISRTPTATSTEACTPWRKRPPRPTKRHVKRCAPTSVRPSTKEILFVGGTTDGINLVAQTWGRANLGAGDCIVLTRMEHHSNIVPWQMLALEQGFDILVVELNEDGTLDGEMFEAHLARNPKLVAFTHVSNALGTVNDVKHWTSRAHDAGATVLVDGAQSVPHLPVNVRDLDVDFYMFSGHKTYGPHGHWDFVRQGGLARRHAALPRRRGDDWHRQL